MNNLNSNHAKPKLLFVDDRTKRIHYAMTEYGKTYDVTIATCVPEALRQLCAQNWDIIDLDHDLNGHDFQDPDTTTCGMEIVRYVQRCGWPEQRKKPIWRVHSSNLFAAHLMKVAIDSLWEGIVCLYTPINYKTDNMKYDKEGLPIK